MCACLCVGVIVNWCVSIGVLLPCMCAFAMFPVFLYSLVCLCVCVWVCLHGLNMDSFLVRIRHNVLITPKRVGSLHQKNDGTCLAQAGKRST